KVVHTNLVPGYSNYGKYIVIEHRWDGSNYFSLYGHLNSIAVQPGESVQRGQRIGVMGYTGVGLNQARAHVHLELNLMLSHQFEAWHNAFFKNDPNQTASTTGSISPVSILRGCILPPTRTLRLRYPSFFRARKHFIK